MPYFYYYLQSFSFNQIGEQEGGTGFAWSGGVGMRRWLK
jgi:hypothetical protein